MPLKSTRAVRLVSYPQGLPERENFEIVEVPLESPQDGDVLVQNLWMTVDPYMRGRMRPGKSYVDAFEIGAILDGEAIGKVIESNSPDFKVGDEVRSYLGWREAFVSPGQGLQKVPDVGVPSQAFLGVLGMPGLTAWVGLLEIGQPKEGETVFVSAASGAVGSLVCQIAKIKGCHVVGTAGSDDKVRWLLDEIGIDHAINYKTTDSLSKALRDVCPDGIDVYFENVGGEHLTAALDAINNFGRIAVCGMISQYNATKAVPGPANLTNVIAKRLRIQGFIVSDHFDSYPAFLNDMKTWMAEGKIKWKETVLDGLDNAPQAFLNLFSGDNFGKMLVRLSSSAKDQEGSFKD